MLLDALTNLAGSINPKELAVKTVTSVLAAAITYVLTVVFKVRIPLPLDMLVWRKLRKGAVLILSERESSGEPKVQIARSLGQVPVGEAIALSRIWEKLAKTKSTPPVFASVMTRLDWDAKKHENLLLIGGPKHNLATQYALTELNFRLQYQFKRLRDSQNTPLDDITLKQFLGPNGESVALTEVSDVEYGTILITKNPFNLSRILVCLAGLNQLSTLACTIWATKLSPLSADYWRIVYLLAKKGNVQALISCRVTDNIRVTNIKCLKILPLKA